MQTKPRHNLAIGHHIIDWIITQFYDDLADEIWRPGYIYNKRQEEIRAAKGEPLTGAHRKLTHYRTDYIVIGPVSTNQQRATGNYDFVITFGGLNNTFLFDTIVVCMLPIINLLAWIRYKILLMHSNISFFLYCNLHH